MKIGSLIFIIFLLNTFSGLSQKPNTYALVIGISAYQEIIPLDYAHKDAEVFANFLQTNGGGNVPKENITTLINEEATSNAMYVAFYELTRKTSAGDLVYIYFSGHGELENAQISKSSYLLAVNTPKQPFTGNAVKIEEVNDYANTLSLKNGAKVIMIVDACRSGKLVNDDPRSQQLAAEQLRITKENQLRITSSGPGQLSNEGEKWGGGRGAFSYYLINGLSGLAKADKAGNITNEALAKYVDSCFANDDYLKQKENKQTPIFLGNSNFPLAKLDKKLLQTVNQTNNQQNNLDTPEKQEQSYFWDVLKEFILERVFDFKKLNSLNETEITTACLVMMEEFCNKNKPQNDNHKNAANYFTKEKKESLQKIFSENEFALRQFKNKLMITLGDRGQATINAYLSGDAAELEKRQYYNIAKANYDVFPNMFAVASKLAPTEALKNMLIMKKYYFEGVALRLKIPLFANPKSLVDSALQLQLKALSIADSAANIHNELGILYLHQNKLDLAKKYFEKAIELCPNWAIPYSNLAAIQIDKKELDKGKINSEKAIQLEPSYQNAYTNLGLIAEQKKDYLYAEEMYKKGIKLNSRYYLPFERLGYVYMKTARPVEADSFLYEAEERKRGYHFSPKILPQIAAFNSEPPLEPCNVDTLHIEKKDILGFLVWGLNSLTIDKNYIGAEKRFRTVIQLDNKNYLAYHYLGKALFYQKRWQEAEINFKRAQQFYFVNIDNYIDSLIKINGGRDCYKQFIQKHYYNYDGDYYYLGETYMNWNHNAEAEEMFRAAIKYRPDYVGGYWKLWRLLEKIGKYLDAEMVLKQYKVENEKDALQKNYKTYLGTNYLGDFYRRMILRYPNDADWNYKAGVFYYSEIAKDTSDYNYDKKIKSIEVKELDALQKEKARDQFEPIWFKDLEADTFKFYESGIGINKEIHVEIPGTCEKIEDPSSSIYPYSLGFKTLHKSDSLLQYDENYNADINYKLGDMYVWVQQSEKSLKHYEKSLMLKPNNASTRMKLVDNYTQNGFYRNSLLQLDSLNKRKEITWQHQMLYSKYLMLSNRAANSETVINEVEKIVTDTSTLVKELRRKLWYINENPKKAIPLYVTYIKINPKDVYTLYELACIYAMSNDQKNAISTLEKCVAIKFDLHYVLKYDLVWKPYASNSEFKNIQFRTRNKTYPKRDFDVR
jgi:tetratricopeptide (TPR) repeat protein